MNEPNEDLARRIQRLARDWAKVENITYEEALKRIMDMITGDAEPLRIIG